MAVKALSEIGDTWKNYEVIGIDEGQFFRDVSNIRFYLNLSIIDRRVLRNRRPQWQDRDHLGTERNLSQRKVQLDSRPCPKG